MSRELKLWLKNQISHHAKICNKYTAFSRTQRFCFSYKFISSPDHKKPIMAVSSNPEPILSIGIITCNDVPNTVKSNCHRIELCNLNVESIIDRKCRKRRYISVVYFLCFNGSLKRYLLENNLIDGVKIKSHLKFPSVTDNVVKKTMEYNAWSNSMVNFKFAFILCIYFKYKGFSLPMLL